MVGSPYSLPEARVLYALGRDGQSTATGDRQRARRSTSATSSRLLQSLQRRGLLQAKRAAHDARQQHLTLTRQGPQGVHR